MAIGRHAWCLLLVLVLQDYLCSGQKENQLINAEVESRENINVGGKNYFLKLSSHLLDECRAECAALNLTLVTFDGPREYPMMLSGLQENGFDRFWYWSNGFRRANSTEWVWLTAAGEVPITEFFWAPRQPDDDTSLDTCINFNVAEGGWEDDPCDGERPLYLSYICE